MLFHLHTQELCSPSLKFFAPSLKECRGYTSAAKLLYYIEVLTDSLPGRTVENAESKTNNAILLL